MIAFVPADTRELGRGGVRRWRSGLLAYSFAADIRHAAVRQTTSMPHHRMTVE